MSMHYFLDVLVNLNTSRSRNTKIEILKANRYNLGLQKYLEYALSPYITWGVSRLQPAKCSSKDFWDDNDLDFLEKASKHNVSAFIYSQWLGQFTFQFQSFLIGMLTKKPRIGISETTVLEVIPNLWKEFRVPLAYPVEWPRVHYPCIAQVKIDGLRCIYNEGQFFSRKGLPIHGLDDIAKTLEKCLITLDGEIWAPGKSFDEISGKIRSFNKVKNAHYYVFDCSIDQPYEMRHAALLQYQMEWKNVSVPQTKIVNSQEEAVQFYDEAIKNGFEGIMLKDMNALPFTGRKYLWQKMKPIDTVDIQVIRVEEGEGKYTGMVGTLVINYRGNEVRVGTGLSDEQRKKWWSCPSLILGHIVEVAFMEESSKGKLRHPRLIQVRGDK